jgi:hypothetical protein
MSYSEVHRYKFYLYFKVHERRFLITIKKEENPKDHQTQKRTDIGNNIKALF